MPRQVNASTQRKIIETTIENAAGEEQDPRVVSAQSPQNEDFFQMIADIPATDWTNKRISITVYRKEPPVDTQRPDRASFAFKKETAFDESYVSGRYGGGLYEYWFKEGGNLKARGFFVIGGAPKSPAEWNQEAKLQPAAFAGGEKNSELVSVIKDLIAKAQNPDEMRKSMENALEIMKTAYMKSAETVAAQRGTGDADGFDKAIDRLVKLGLLKTGNSQDNMLQTIAMLKELGLVGDKREDLLDQIEKIKAIGDVLGWSGGRGAGDEDWRIALTRSAPDILGGLERITTNIVQAIQAGRGQPVQQNPPAQPPATQPPPAQLPAQQVSQQAMQQALDGLVKGKLIEFYRDEIEPEEVVMWLELTAPAMVDDLKKFDADQVHKFFLTDPLLQEIGKEPGCKLWIEKILKEMKAEPVGA